MVYRHTDVQLSFESFDCGLGTSLSPDNEWVKLASLIPWQKLDEAYQSVFNKSAGRAAKPFRELYGAELIKQRTHLSDAKLVEAIRDTPAFQYFMGRTRYEAKIPFNASTLTYFRRRASKISDLIRNIITDEVREKLEAIVPGAHVLITDATAVPIKIQFPQDASLLNKSRLNLEEMVLKMAQGLQVAIPRTYKRLAKATWTEYSRHPGRQAKARRKQIKAQLQYIRRDLRYVDELLSQGGEAHLTEWQINRLAVVRKVYEQQRYMYDNKTHSVPDRIVSLSQPYIHPIVRGKAKARVEFGAKIDCSILDGVIDVERFDFESFNESTDLAATLDHCWDTLGQYPDEVLADTLYRIRANIALCKELGIKLSGPKLGRRPKHVDANQRKLDTDAENRRGAIERKFAFLKGSLGLDLVNTRTAESLVVEVDSAIVLANLMLLLGIFSIPISVITHRAGKTYQINYKVITERSKSAA